MCLIRNWFPGANKLRLIRLMCGHYCGFTIIAKHLKLSIQVPLDTL